VGISSVPEITFAHSWKAKQILIWKYICM